MKQQIEVLKYDLAIIGGGIAGLSAAQHASRAGLNVIIFEKRNFGGLSFNGGDLLWRELYKKATEHIHFQNTHKQNTPFPLIEALKTYRQMSRRYVKGFLQIVDETDNITFVNKEAHIVKEGIIKAGNLIYQAKNIIIAAGAKPNTPAFDNIPALQKCGFYLKSHEIYKLKSQPQSMVISGGSTVAFEIAIFFANIGTKVTILVREEVLRSLDEDMRHEYLRVIKHKNLKILKGAVVSHLQPGRVYFTHKGKNKSLKCDHYVSAIGFGPRIITSDLPFAYDKNGLITNQYGQTNIPYIYAIGDITNKPKYSNLAFGQGAIVINHILGYDDPFVDRATIRQMVGFFQYAQYGKKEEELALNNTPYIAIKPPKELLNAGEDKIAYFKILFHKYTHEVLGIHIISQSASVHIDLIMNILRMHTMLAPINRDVFSSSSFLVGQMISEILNELRHNSIYKEYESFYQLKVDLKTNKIVGAESLARFFIDGSYRNPLPFIEIFEKSGFIAELDFQVIRNACQLLMKLKRENLLTDDFTISVNISPVTLSLTSAQKIDNVVCEYPIDRRNIVFEITERVAENKLNFVQTITTLQAKGYQISMDDFSVGNSSLNLLHLINFAEVKIDRDVLPKDSDDKDGQRIYQNLITLLKGKNTSITSEGVETPFQANFLKENGVDVAQGYFFGRPINTDNFIAILKEWKSKNEVR